MSRVNKLDKALRMLTDEVFNRLLNSEDCVTTVGGCSGIGSFGREGSEDRYQVSLIWLAVVDNNSSLSESEAETRLKKVVTNAVKSEYANMEVHHE